MGYGEDGSHVWSSHTITGAEGAWAGDIACVAEHFKPGGAILGGYIRGQYPSHWVATKRSDREVDVHGIVTMKVEGGGSYTAHVHEYMKFWEPCVTINITSGRSTTSRPTTIQLTGTTRKRPSSTPTGTTDHPK